MATYNGWKNWATWNVALWVCNDEATYRAIVEMKPYTACKARRFCEVVYPIGTPDMQGASAFEAAEAMTTVDWDEIADSFNAS